jgi:hypothetical protein
MRWTEQDVWSDARYGEWRDAGCHVGRQSINDTNVYYLGKSFE